jgi:tetratricopeptide (TPR) repeat protein
MKKIIFTLIIILLTAVNSTLLIADDYSDAMKKTIKKLGEVGEKSDKSALLKVRGDFERVLQLKKNEWMVNYYLGSVDVMLSRIASEEKNMSDVQKYTESAISLFDKSTDVKDDFAEAYIMKMAVQSNRWQYEPNKMNDIIAKSTEAKDMAYKLEPKNPRYYLIDGFNVFYTPENFGGGVDKALPLFEKSWENFQTYKPVDETYPNWGNDQAAGMVAMCYIKMEKPDDAKKWIDKAFEVKPESGFIKGFVMPEYEKIKK